MLGPLAVRLNVNNFGGYKKFIKVPGSTQIISRFTVELDPPSLIPNPPVIRTEWGVVPTELFVPEGMDSRYSMAIHRNGFAKIDRGTNTHNSHFTDVEP